MLIVMRPDAVDADIERVLKVIESLGLRTRNARPEQDRHWHYRK